MTDAYEWDEAKRLGNLSKHGLDFRQAWTVWRGVVLEPYATRLVDGEPRRTTIGVYRSAAGGEIVVAVVWTWRGTRRRIITLRSARRNERADHDLARG